MLTPEFAPVPAQSRMVRLVDDPRIAIATIIGGFVAIDLLRTSTYQPGDGTSLLYALPVTVAGMRFGPRVGALTGLAAFGLFAFWVARNDTTAITTSAYVTRLVVFVLIGSFVGWLARARDELDERSRQLVDVSPDLMAMLDEHGRAQMANRAWVQAAGRPFHPGMPVVTASSEAGEVEAAEQAITFADGDLRWYDWRVRSDDPGRRRFVVGRDVTERHEQALHIQHLLSEVQGARDHERASLASDLHDFVLQQLLVSLMHLEPLREATDPAQAREATRVDELVRHATARLRRVIDGIRPLDLDHMTTAAALELCADLARRDWGLGVETRIGLLQSYASDLTLCAYRVVGEALHNAAKHADAQHVLVEASEVDAGIVIEVRDDGSGFGEHTIVDGSPSRAYGTGFNLLIEQVRGMGGHLRVESGPGVGTTVRCELPVPVRDGEPLG